MLTLLTRSWPRRTVLIGLMAIFTIGNAACALAPSYPALMAARVVTALAHKTFFGVGSVVATWQPAGACRTTYLRGRHHRPRPLCLEARSHPWRRRRREHGGLGRGQGRSLAAATPRGRLRVTLPTIGYRFLLPVLPEFGRRYPAVELDLDFNDRIVGVVEGGYDAAIRSGDLANSQLMSRRLGGFRFILCAAPAYPQRAGTPGCLLDHTRIRLRFPSTGKLQSWDVSGLPDAIFEHRSARLTCSNMEAVRAAAIAASSSRMRSPP